MADILGAKLPFIENQLVHKWLRQEKKEGEKVPKIFTCKGSDYYVGFQVKLRKQQYLTIYAGKISLAVGRDNNKLPPANLTGAIGK